MKPYNEAAICPKCKSADVRVSYHRAGTYPWGSDCGYGGPCQRDSVLEEHMLRICQRCRYEWNEGVAR